MRILISILLLTLPFCATAQTRRPATPASRLRPAPSIEPQSVRYSTQLLRNSDLRVQRLDIPAEQSTAMRQDTHNYLLIALAPVTLGVSGGNTKFDFELTEGGMQVVSGGWPHHLTNKSDQEAHILAIELTSNIDPEHATCGLAATNCNEVRFGKTEEGEYSQAALFETKSAKLVRAELGPNGVLKLHAHTGRHLVISLTAMRAETERGALTLAPGDVYWLDGGFQHLANNGPDSARFLILELK